MTGMDNKIRIKIAEGSERRGKDLSIAAVEVVTTVASVKESIAAEQYAVGQQADRTATVPGGMENAKVRISQQYAIAVTQKAIGRAIGGSFSGKIIQSTFFGINGLL